MRVLRRPRRLAGMSLLIGGTVLALTGQSLVATAAVPPAASAPAQTASVRPNPVGELDCNGFSSIQKPIKQTLACADPRGSDAGRFEDHGHYIGHDEPTVRFVSNRAGSGSNVTFTETLPRDPKQDPTVKTPGHDVTHWFELSIAPWFSTDVCDPWSAPLLPCKARSDANAPRGKYLGAGAGFVELQFYPPGFAPFADSISCNNKSWCSALNIDSLECVGSGITVGPCNNNCVEPVNFGFIQTNGVPTGPPSPQLSDLATFTPDSHTLMMSPGDKIRVQMFDAKIPGGHALEAKETDLTTGKSGFMIASAANGFKDTNPFDCSGRKFNFQPEYSSARPANLLPWGVGPYMINTQFEIGHFEPCTKVSGKGTVTIGSFTDTYFKHCSGPYEPTMDKPSSFEPDDSPCYMKGDTHGGVADPNLVTGCDVFFNAIGDLDYDGTNYRADWPDSATAHTFPSPFLQHQPVTVGGHRYSRIQFITDASATEFNTNCNEFTGKGCVLPPKGPGHFYPYWTLARVGGRCVWEFGNMTNGRTFGKLKQYGKVGPGTIGAFAGPIRPNPTGC
jgi:hypothetical protein